MSAEKRSRHIQEMDTMGLLQLLSRLTYAGYHQAELKKEAQAQLSTRGRKAREGQPKNEYLFG